MKKFLMVATALVTGAAVAQTAPVSQSAPAMPQAAQAPMAHPMRDKVMTRAETVAMVREHFGQMDANKDGSITTAEISETRGKWVGKHKDFEGHGDHAMRFEKRDPNAAFDRLDTNRDGSISRDEFAKAHEERIERRVEIREKRKEGAKDGKEARHSMRMHHGGGGGGRMIAMADTDKDGQITLAEAEALALQHFDQMDTNRDGQVTPEERRAGRHMMFKRSSEEKKSGS
jgi:Ca2+-binding EF-hand superfamily protein